MYNILTSVFALLCVSQSFALPAQDQGMPNMPPGFGGPGGPGGPGFGGPGGPGGPGFGGPGGPDSFFAKLESVPNSQELMMCVQPVMGYIFSMMGMPGDPSGGPTRDQFTQVCTIGKSFFQCVDAWVGRQTMQVSPDVRTVLQGTRRILNFCDEPEAYENVTRFVACGKKLQAVQNECPEFKQSRKRVEDKLQKADPMEVLKNIKVVEDLCCRLNLVVPCVKGKTERLCGAADRDFFQSMVDRINTEFKCATKTSNCRAILA